MAPQARAKRRDRESGRHRRQADVALRVSARPQSGQRERSDRKEAARAAGTAGGG